MIFNHIFNIYQSMYIFKIFSRFKKKNQMKNEPKGLSNCFLTVM